MDHELRIIPAKTSDAQYIARIWLDCIRDFKAAPTETDAIAAFEERIRLPQRMFLYLGCSRKWSCSRVAGLERFRYHPNH
jgi:hypothetical protein